MTAQHTPGPWMVPHFALSDEHWDKFNQKFGCESPSLRRRCDCKYVLCESYMGAICTVHVDNGKKICDGGGDDPPLEEAKANARLIAAAPELLEALKGVVAIADRKTVEFDRARAAIAKAEGLAITKEATKHTPGSDEAVKLGCTCPRMDNSFGKGYLQQPGIFWYSHNCPVHQSPKNKHHITKEAEGNK